MSVNIQLIDVSTIATANSTANTYFIDVVGNKTDNANRTAGQSSLMGLLRQVDADITTVLGSLGAASVVTGTADSGTAGTLVDAALTQANDYFNGMILVMTSGNNVGLARTIVDFVAASDTVVVEPNFPNAIGADTYVILPRDQWANILIGNNNADNEADTSSVVANVDGSVLERLEHLVTQLLAGGDIHDVLYADATGASITADVATIDGIVDAILVDTGTTIPAVLGTPTGADLATDIADVSAIASRVDVNLGDPSGDTLTTITAKIGDLPLDLATLIGSLADLGSGATIGYNAVDIAGATFDTATDSNEAIRNQLDTLVGSPVADLATDIATVDGIVDTLNTNLGNPAGDTLTSITAKLGDLPSDLATLIGTPAADISADIAAVKTVADNIYTSVDTEIISIKNKTDNLPVDTATTLGTLATAAANGSNNSSGTFSYLDAGGEQDVVEITNTTRKIVNGIWLDAINLTNNGTFKVYYKVDGTNYREITDLAYAITAGTTEAIFINANFGITEDIKVTYTELADEGAARDIPYSVVYETKE